MEYAKLKYRKLPVEIEAQRFNTNNEAFGAPSMDSIVGWINGSGGEASHDGTDIYVHTLEGVMRASVGDWIIRGVKGEFYPCKGDIFAATYEHVDAVASEADERTANNAVRHQYRVLGEVEKAAMVRIKDAGLQLLQEIRIAGGQRPDQTDGPFGSRELSIAGTKTEEAVMWAVKHVTR